jgi:hypothetical protein
MTITSGPESTALVLASTDVSRLPPSMRGLVFHVRAIGYLSTLAWRRISDPLIATCGEQKVDLIKPRVRAAEPARISSSSMQCETLRSVARALAAVGLVLLLAVTLPSPATSQETDDRETGGLARTEEELGALGRLADMPERVPRKEAIRAYNRGLEALDKASRLDATAAAGNGDKAARKTAKAQESYARAIEQLRAAVELEPGFYQALGSLGYALLRTGQYEASLEAYDRALEIGPVYPEAIAERAEACLELDQIEEAKRAWTVLVRVDRDLATGLVTAMKRWIDARRVTARGVSDKTIDDFATWIDARTEPGGSASNGRPGQPQSVSWKRP